MTGAVGGHCTYNLCGWHFRSEIPIEALPEWHGDQSSPIDIELSRGIVPHVACDQPVCVIANGTNEATVVAEDAGRFLVVGGTKVIADVWPGSLSGVVETMILGPVLGALCYQRGVL